MIMNTTPGRISDATLAQIEGRLKQGGTITLVCNTGRRWPVASVDNWAKDGVPFRCLTLKGGQGAISAFYEGDTIELN